MREERRDITLLEDLHMSAKFKALLVRSVRIGRNALMDMQYGGLLGGAVETPYAHLGAVKTENTDYVALSSIFRGRIKDSDVLVDVGCGKGRVINFWLSQGLCNRMVGIELNDKIADETRRRLIRYKNVTILTGNATENIPVDGTLFYLYNPFDAHVMEAFKNRLITLFGRHSNITVLYYRCKHVHVFQSDPTWVVEIRDVGGPSAFPFDQLAVIKTRQ